MSLLLARSKYVLPSPGIHMSFLRFLLSVPLQCLRSSTWTSPFVCVALSTLNRFLKPQCQLQPQPAWPAQPRERSFCLLSPFPYFPFAITSFLSLILNYLEHSYTEMVRIKTLRPPHSQIQWSREHLLSFVAFLNVLLSLELLIVFPFLKPSSPWAYGSLSSLTA